MKITNTQRILSLLVLICCGNSVAAASTGILNVTGLH
ncbi:Uncharacterised protein [Serratia fonticola]|uniref:Uncharacterized protein n=1 Tax=Serratia fonticola TaxID=47917 RepID=A0A4U9VSE0_SERFO|nr:Uncharacterised protein [Serratia fonticola]